MSDEQNPYRYSAAIDEQASARTIDEEWDLREYVPPEDEPILSPAEIRTIGKKSWGMSTGAFVDQIVALIIGALVLSSLSSSGGRNDDWRVGAIFGSLFLIIQAAIAFDVYRLARALRRSAGVAVAIGVLGGVSIVNLFLLLSLAYDAEAALQRHGIPGSFWGPPLASLPRRRRTPRFKAPS